MRSFLLFILLATVANIQIANAQTTTVSSQDSVAAVQQVVQNMFIAMKNSDTVLLKTCFSNNVIFQTIVNKAGEVSVKNESLQDFINSIGKQPVGSLDEQIKFESIKVNRELASVWTPYQFFYKEKYSHSGVNSFQLVKLKEGWKIQYIIDTRYR
jgi:hypothetical protein